MEENTKSFWDNKNLEVTDEVLSMEESSMLYDIVSNEDKYAEEVPDIVTESDNILFFKLLCFSNFIIKHLLH